MLDCLASFFKECLRQALNRLFELLSPILILYCGFEVLFPQSDFNLHMLDFLMLCFSFPIKVFNGVEGRFYNIL